MSYAIQLINRKGVIVQQKEVGHWRDRAAELYGSMARRMDGKSPYKLQLVDTTNHDHEVLYSKDERWTELNRPW